VGGRSGDVKAPAVVGKPVSLARRDCGDLRARDEVVVAEPVAGITT